MRSKEIFRKRKHAREQLILAQDLLAKLIYVPYGHIDY